VAPPGIDGQAIGHVARGAVCRRTGAAVACASLDDGGRDHQGARVTARAEPSAAGWLAAALERRFALAAARTTVQREVLAASPPSSP